MKKPTAPISVDRILEETAWLRALTRSLVAREDLADEIMQETLLLAMRREGHQITETRPWLSRVARSIAGQIWRKQARRREVEGKLEHPREVPDTVSVVARAESQKLVTDATLQLPEPYRTTILLRFLEERSYAQIAESMQVSIETVRTRVKRGLERLRDSLDRRSGNRSNHARCDWALAILGVTGLDVDKIAVPSTSTALSTALVVVTMNKSIWGGIALAVSVCVLLLWSDLLWPDDGEEHSPSDVISVQEPHDEKLVGAKSPATKDPVASPERKRQAEELSPGTGSLLVRVIHAKDKSPATNTVIQYRTVADRDPLFASKRGITDGQGLLRVAGMRPGRVFAVVLQHVNAANFGEVVAGEETELLIEIKDGIRLSGIVVDPDGLPVPHAAIVLYMHMAGPALSIGRAGDDGSFSLQGVWQHCYVGARAPGFAPSIMQSILASKGGSVDVRITLPAIGGSISGRVVGPNGLGVGGAVIRVGSIKHKSTKLPDGTRGREASAVEVRSTADGSFLVQGLAVGNNEVQVRARDLAPWLSSCEVQPALAAPLLVRLQAGVQCSGQIKDTRGEVAAKVRVSVGDYRSIINYRALTDKEGRYELRGLPPGEIRISASLEDKGKASTVLHAVAGAKKTWNAQLSLGWSLRGIVLTETGKPVVSAMVLVAERGKTSFAMDRTNKEGRFTVRNCPQGKALTVHVQADGYSSLSRTVLEPQAGELVLRIKYHGKATARIKGIVLDPDGKPLENVWLTPIARNRSGGRVYTTEANTGRFNIGPFPPGYIRIATRTKAYPKWQSEERQLSANEVWDLGTIRLVHGGRLELRVIEGDKLLTTAVSAEILQTWESRAGYISIKDNSVFRSEPLAPGAYRLQISGKGIAAQSIPFTVREGQETKLSIKLSKGISQTFEFVVPKATPSTDRIHLTIKRENRVVYSRRVWRTIQGRRPYSLVLQPGSYVAQVLTDHGFRAEASFVVPQDGGKSTTLRLVFR